MGEGKSLEQKELIPVPTKEVILDFIENNEDKIIECILERNSNFTIAKKLNISRSMATATLAEFFKSRGLIPQKQNRRIRDRFSVMAAIELDEAKKEVYKIMKRSEDDNIKLKAAASLSKMIGDELNLLKELGILTYSTPKEKEGVDVAKSLEKIRKNLEHSINEELSPEDGL